MTRIAYLLVLAIIVVTIALIVAGQLGFLRGAAPADLGLTEGKLKRPSKTQNSVSSQADLWPGHPMASYAQIAALKTTGDGSADMAKLATVLKAMPRTVIVKQDANYIYAQSTTALLNFTDDVEFALDAAAGVIHVRSASRLGALDFGVNRARVESIRAAMGN